MDEELVKAIQERSRKVIDPAGREVMVLEEFQALDLAKIHSLSLHHVYVEALTSGITPYRYLRNREGISLSEQLKLAGSCAAVVGAGGLGGQVILLLARIGIGRLIVIDHDVFDETNLNRQALCGISALGKSKSQEAVNIVGSVNPGVEVVAHRARLDGSTGPVLLADAQVVVDALDTIQDRLILEGVARDMKIPLVHGALAGFEGEVMTIFPEDGGLKLIYGSNQTGKDMAKRPEAVLGVPAITPSFIATLQAMEAFKILLGRGKILRNTMTYVDLEQGMFQQFSFEGE